MAASNFVNKIEKELGFQAKNKEKSKIKVINEGRLLLLILKCFYPHAAFFTPHLDFPVNHAKAAAQCLPHKLCSPNQTKHSVDFLCSAISR